MQGMARDTALGDITNRHELNPDAKPFVPLRFNRLQPCLPAAAQAVVKRAASVEGLREQDGTKDAPSPAETVAGAPGGSQQEATPNDNTGSAETEIAEQPALPEHTTLGQWLRTCASATDLDVASIISVAPSQASSANGDRAAPGLKHSNGRRLARQTGVPGLQTADAYAQLKMHGSPSSHSGLRKAGQAEAWTPRSCKDFQVHQDGGSPRSCVTSVAGRAPRLPKWAMGLEAVQSPQLQALAQQWQQQQAHLSSVHLHPHEEEQDAELSYLQDNSTAFGDQEPAAEPEGAQTQEVAALEGESVEGPSGSSRSIGLLSQALQTQHTAPVPTVAKGTGVESFVEDAPGTSTVMRLVRHWQHHPISLAPVSKLRLERSDATAAGASSSGSNRRFVTPVVLSKVQHFLESSNAAAPSGIPSYTSPITAATGHATGGNNMAQPTMQAMPPAHPLGTPGAARAAIATGSSVRRHNALDRQRGCPGIRSDRSVEGASCWSTVTQAGRTQWWGKDGGSFFSEKGK